MDARDPLTATHFNQRIDFRHSGAATFAGIHFGRELAARITGAPDGATVVLDVDDEVAAFTVNHPIFAQEAQRILTQDGGQLSIANNDLRLRTTGTGLGARMFAQQAHAARALGVAHIDVCAGAGMDDDGRQLNGLYTWPRFGFDAPLRWSLQDIVTPAPSSVDGAITVQDVMERGDEARLWWRNRDCGALLRFDLAAGSISWRVFEAYLVGKDIIPGVGIGELP